MPNAVLREQAERLVAEFLKNGGTIQKIPVGVIRDQGRSGLGGAADDGVISTARQQLFSDLDATYNQVAPWWETSGPTRGLRAVRYGGALEDDYNEESYP